jgi:hypothetical protein
MYRFIFSISVVKKDFNELDCIFIHTTMVYPILAPFLLLLGLLSLVPNAYTACISDGDETTINNLLSSGGPNTVVSLCANAVFNLKDSIVFTAENQELSTEGYPADSTRATLVVTGANQTSAIIGMLLTGFHIMF